MKDKINLNERDNEGNTAIHIAVELDKLEIIKYLIEKGANIHPDSYG
ncbi:MAG: ankyrin repeat domain-containing protein, partial [Wolbachia endosymbiont of Fragariocoptes setiger]|nr:ankyrin repeat domain-containing protein [Wolbachia endosymbiont of Fragariocoptes setiger]